MMELQRNIMDVIQLNGTHFIKMTDCKHKQQDRKIIIFYRKNYPFGRKSESKKYNPPRMKKEVCENCGKEINRWKP